MVNWIIVIILLVVGLFAIKMNHLKHRIFIIVLILLALFLYTSVIFIEKQNKIDLNNAEGVLKATKLYTGWLANGFHNIKSVTGNLAKMNWTSTNGTFFQNKSSTKK